MQNKLSQAAQYILENIRNNKSLVGSYIQLYNDAIGDKEAKMIAEALKVNNTVYKVDLHRNQIGDDGAKAIADALRVNKTITQLHVNDNQIGDEGAKAIAELLKVNKTLTEVSLHGNKIGDEGAKAIAEALFVAEGFNKHQYQIYIPQLYNNNIGDEGAKAIAELLKFNKNKQVPQLSLHSNTIGDEGAKAIAEALKFHKSINVYLSNNKIGDEGAKAIAELWKINPGAMVYLSNNEIGDEGAKAIAEPLGVNETMMWILLEGNKVGDEGIKAIAEGFKKNNNIHLNTNNFSCGSNIGPEGAKAIAEALKVNKTIQSFYLRNNKIGDEGARAIADALRVNKTITNLYLENNQIGDDGAKAIADALRVNKTNITINLENNQIGDDGAKAIADACKYNRSIYHFTDPNSGHVCIALGNNKIGDNGAKAILEALSINIKFKCSPLRDGSWGKNTFSSEIIAHFWRVNAYREKYLDFIRDSTKNSEPNCDDIRGGFFLNLINGRYYNISPEKVYDYPANKLKILELALPSVLLSYGLKVLKSFKQIVLQDVKKNGPSIYKDAIMIFDKMIKGDNKNASLYTAKGLMYEVIGDTKNALRDYNTASFIDPSSIEVSTTLKVDMFVSMKDVQSATKSYLECINVYKKLGDYDHALETCNKAIDLDTKNIDLYYQKMDIYLEINKYEMLIKTFDAMKDVPDLGKCALLIIERCKKGDKYKLAIEICEKAISLDPKNLDLHHQKIKLYATFGDKDKALKACDETIKLYPKDPNAYEFKVDLYTSLDDKENAIKSTIELFSSAEKYIKLIGCYKDLLALYISNGRLTEGIEIIGSLKEVAENVRLQNIDPNEALFERQMKLKQYKEASETCERGLAESKKHLHWYRCKIESLKFLGMDKELSECYAEMFRYCDAQIEEDLKSVKPLYLKIEAAKDNCKYQSIVDECYEKIFVLEPDEALHYSSAAKIYTLARIYSEANGYASRAIEMKPSSEDGYAAMANLYIDIQDYDKAKEICELGLTKSDSTEGLRICLSKIYYQKYLQAKTNLDKLHHIDFALKYQPNMLDALVSKAAVLMELGRSNDAAECLTDAMKVQVEAVAYLGRDDIYHDKFVMYSKIQYDNSNLHHPLFEVFSKVYGPAEAINQLDLVLPYKVVATGENPMWLI